MDQFRLPPPLVLSGNTGENWRRWIQRFNIYMTASGSDSKVEKVKIAILLHALGEEALEVYNSLSVESEEEEETTMQDIVTALEKYCLPRKNVVFERHQFWAYPMPDSITIDKYVTELKQKSKDCEFGSTESEMLRDKIVFSIGDQRLKERLLREINLTLEKTVDICRAAEAAKTQIQAMGEQNKIVHAVSHAVRKKTTEAKPNKVYERTKSQLQKVHVNSFICKKCGKSHLPRQCPAFGATCHACGKCNHFASVCMSIKKDIQPKYNRSVTVDSLFIGTVELKGTHSFAQKAWYTDVDIGNVTVKFKLDSGAEANILPLDIYKSLQETVSMQPTSTMLVAYGGTKLRPEGLAKLQCVTPKVQVCLPFYITRHSSIPILGKEACERMQLLKRVDTVLTTHPTSKEELIAQHSAVFEGLGQFPGEHHIHVDPKAVPVIHGCRKIPLAVLGKLKDTLDQLLQADVIAPVTQPTPWVNSLVITEKKNGLLRVCLDPRDLNKAVLRQHFSIPTTEDVLCKLAGKKIFSIFDEKDGYWQVKLDRDSSLLCTFNTPWGRYRFKRLPFGVKSASEVFQQYNNEVFGDIKGVHIVADDMIVAAATELEHDVIVAKIMERARTHNVKFNPDKIQYKVNKVNFMGHVITPQGVRADDGKIQAIVNMPTPTDRQSLQRLLGMIRYLAPFIPGEASLTTPLRQLLRKDIAFQWQPEHDSALSALKISLTNTPVLRYYDPNKLLTIQTDASKDGLGSCLLQEGQPIAYASRALTETEKNYAQIEKELLAIVFSTKKFHQYVYGHSVYVQSDHKPLEPIFKKPLSKAPARLQRMLLQLQRYDLIVQYTPGKDMVIADALSRAVAEGQHTSTDDLSDERVVYALEATQALSDDTLKQLTDATAKDSTLQLLMKMQKTGWPKHRKQLDFTIQQYWPVRHTVAVQDGILMVSDRILIPETMRSEMLKKLHIAHQGIQRTKAHARKFMYWPGMTRHIEQMVETCTTCQQFQPRNQKEPLISHEVPELPWLKVAADIFEIRGQSFLLIVDYMSKFPEVLNIKDKTASTVIAKMKAVYARHGIPKELVCDHVPFASYEMKKFAAEWGIKLTHSSPAYPQSNGLAERTIKTIKTVLRKAEQSGMDHHLALLSIRNTPVTGMPYSPAQVLMGRVLRSTLPASSEVLRPTTPKGVHQALQTLQKKQACHYNVRAKSLPELHAGNTVHIETDKGWQPGLIVSKRDEPRSYNVVNAAGRQFRRNRRHLRKTIHKHTETLEPADEPNDGAHYESNDDAHSTISVEHEVGDRSTQGVQDQSLRNASTTVTRSGRIVKVPVKFQDYCMN